jgi:hypothetical protein
VTVYELLRLLIRSARLAEPVEHDALELVDELEQLGALGTVAARTAITDHAPAGVNHFNRVCTICQKEH